MKIKMFYIIVISFLLFINFAQAAIPQKIGLNIEIRNSTTNVKVQDGTYSLTFRINDSNNGGNQLWEETQLVNVGNGIAYANLGNNQSLNLSFNIQSYLYVSVNNSNFGIPINFTSVASSFKTINISDVNYDVLPNQTSQHSFGSSLLKWLNGFFNNIFATNINATEINATLFRGTLNYSYINNSPTDVINFSDTRGNFNSTTNNSISSRFNELGNFNLTTNNSISVRFNESAWLSTYNVTYDTWSYNQTNDTNKTIYANYGAYWVNQTVGFLWSYITNIPNIIYGLLTGASNANNLLISNGTAIGYNETILNNSIDTESNKTGNIINWNSTGNIINWNSSGNIINYNASGNIINWNGSGYIRNQTTGIISANSSFNQSLTDNLYIANASNLTIGNKITFALGQIIDGIIAGWIKITGSLWVTGGINTTSINVTNINSSGNINASNFYGDGSGLTNVYNYNSTTNNSISNRFNESYWNYTYNTTTNDSITQRFNELGNFNSTTNNTITTGINSKAGIGNCQDGFVVMNTTSSGVQCVAAGGNGANYNFGSNNFNGSGNFTTTGNATFGQKITFSLGSILQEISDGITNWIKITNIWVSNIFRIGDAGQITGTNYGYSVTTGGGSYPIVIPIFMNETSNTVLTNYQYSDVYLIQPGMAANLTGLNLTESDNTTTTSFFISGYNTTHFNMTVNISQAANSNIVRFLKYGENVTDLSSTAKTFSLMDTASRANQNGWGNADTGQTWLYSGNASVTDYVINSSRLGAKGAAGFVFTALGNKTTPFEVNFIWSFLNDAGIFSPAAFIKDDTNNKFGLMMDGRGALCPDGHFCTNDNSGWTTLNVDTLWALNRNYSIKLIIYPSNNTFQVYIDGIWKHNALFTNNGVPEWIKFNDNDAVGGGMFTIDNLYNRTFITSQPIYTLGAVNNNAAATTTTNYTYSSVDFNTSIKIAANTSKAICNATYKGAVYYDGGTDNGYLCKASGWTAIT